MRNGEVIDDLIEEYCIQRLSKFEIVDLMGVEDVRAWWQTRTLGRKRAIIDTLMTVAIQPIGYGKRPRGVELLETLEITSKG